MNKKYLPFLYVGAGLLGVYAIAKLFKSKEEREVDNVDKQPTLDGSTVAMIGDIPLTPAMANSIAQTIHDAMRYCGTEEEIILTTLSQGLNGKALQKIYKAFGLKEAGVLVGCHGDTSPFPGTKKDLGTYFVAEMSGQPELDAIRTIFKKANIVF